MPKHISALIVAVVLGTISAVYGGVAGNEALLAIGLTIAFLSLVFIPVLYQRANKRRRLFGRQDALLVWEYLPQEAAFIAARESTKVRKTSIRLSILFSVCLAIIFAPFIVIAETSVTRYLLLYVGIVAVLLPFSSLYFAPAYTSSLIMKTPSMTIVGRDYILVNNRYIGINDRGDLKLETAGFATRDNGYAVLILVYSFRMRYGGRIRYTVDVAVPMNRLEEAKRFADTKAAAGHK